MQEAEYKSWTDQAIFKYGENGRLQSLEPHKFMNYYLCVKNSPTLCGVFAWDEFYEEIFIVKCPPWCSETEFHPRPMTESDVKHCCRTLELHGLSGSMKKTQDSIHMAALENRINVARDFFDDLVWDGTPRLSTWLQDYCGATDDDPAYLTAVGTKWLCAAVARVMNPGCDFPPCLVLETRLENKAEDALRELSLLNFVKPQTACFLETLDIANLDEKRELIKLKGNFVVNASRMADLSCREHDRFQRWLRRNHDEYRPPYNRYPVKLPRQFVVCAVIDPLDGHMIDDTPDYRCFWPVSARFDRDLRKLQQDKEQLWAEAVTRYKAGENLIVDESLFQAPSAAQERRASSQSLYEDEVHAISRFVREKCEVRPSTHAKSGDLYAAYLAWADQRGLTRRVNHNNLTIALRRHGGYDCKGRNGVRLIRGMKLRTFI